MSRVSGTMSGGSSAREEAEQGAERGGWKERVIARMPTGSSGVFWHRVAGTLASRALMVVLGLVTAVLTARVLGPAGRGVFSVLLTIGAIGVKLGNIGLPAAMTYRVASDRSELPALIGTTLLAGLGLGSLLAAAYVLAAILFPPMAPLDSRWLLALGAAWIPFGVLNVLIQNMLLGLHRVRLYNLIQLANKAGGVVLLLLLFVLGVAGVLSFYLASLGILLTVSAYGLGALLHESGYRVKRPSRAMIGELWRYGFRAYLATLFAYVVLHFDLLMVAGTLGDTAAGHYSIAARMGEMIYLAPVSVGSILFATVASMESGQWRFTLRTLKVVTVILIVGLTLAAVLARPVVQLLFGSEFLPAVPAFLWLLPGLLALGVNTILMNYFAGVGFPLIAVVSPGIAAAANIGLNLLLLPVLGIVGASLASTIAYGMMLLSSILYLALTDRQG
jgi:O-antigen/teichoic acid export membrane protein